MKGVALALLLAMSLAHAQPHSGCITDRYGNVACGPAASTCLKDVYGEVRCSTMARSSARKAA